MEVSKEEAVKCYERAVAMNNFFSMYNLANIFTEVSGAHRNPQKAIELYLKASEMGHTASLINLGFLYKMDEELKNIQKAIYYFQKAADRDPYAYSVLGGMHEEGVDLEKDEVKALEYYQKACEQNEPVAICQMASRYEQGRGVERDPSKAFDLYSKAAE